MRAERVLKDFGSSSEDTVLENEYVLARNFMIINTKIDNGQRVGSLLNLKLRHIKNAEVKGSCHVCVCVVSLLSKIQIKRNLY